MTTTTPEPATDAYARELADLLDDARETGRLQRFTDELTITLARIIDATGVGVAGDVMGRLGYYVCSYARQRHERAEAEADAARRAGQRLQ
jgi:hypothetical protein